MKTRVGRSPTGLFVVVVVAAAQTALCQETVFQSGFEYAAGEPTVGTDAANLNFADGQIGEFFGTIPTGAGGQFAPELMGFENNPNGGRLLLVDRPTANGAFSAVLTKEIPTDGATVSFDVGTRRTGGGNRNKDYDIVGFDSGGNESFHLRVITKSANGAPETRLAVVSGGGTETFDLPTVAGADGDGDLLNTGAPPFTADDIANIALQLTDSGYTIDFTRDTISYTTDLLSFNDSTDMLERIEFQFAGGGSNGARTGFILDNLVVTAVPEPASVAIWSLIGLGLAGFGCYRLRRRKS